MEDWEREKWRSSGGRDRARRRNTTEAEEAEELRVAIGLCSVVR